MTERGRQQEQEKNWAARPEINNNKMECPKTKNEKSFGTQISVRYGLWLQKMT